MKKILVMLVCFVAFAATSQAQLTSVTPAAGLTLVKSTTTNYTIPVGKIAMPFSLHAYSVGSVNDTTTIKVYYGNGTTEWELSSTNTIVPSDKSDLVIDTCFARYIKVSVVTGNNDSTGVIHLKMFQ